MKVVEKNCVKKQSKEMKRKNLAVMGYKNYIIAVPEFIIEVVKTTSTSIQVVSEK